VTTIANHTSNRTVFPATQINKLVVFDGHKFIVNQDGNVTNEEGEVVSTLGQEGIIKYIEEELIIKNDKWPKTISQESSTFTMFKNGTVYNAEGELVTEDGWTGLDDLYKKNYTVFNYNGKLYHVYDDEHVTNADGETILEEGGLDSLIKKLESQYTVWVINDNLKLFTNAEGVVTFANGTVLCEGGIENATHIFHQFFEQKYYYIYTVNGDLYYVDEASGKLFNSTGGFIYQASSALEALAFIDEDFSYFTYDDVTYRWYSNGTVTNKAGNETLVKEGGFQKFYKDIKAVSIERNYDTYICNDETYYSYTNGTVYNSEGESVIIDGGILECARAKCQNEIH